MKVTIMKRPKLTLHISMADFQGFYCLKEELVTFCRQNGLPTVGSKKEIATRIEYFLLTGDLSPTVTPTKRSITIDRLPDQLSRDTVIGSHWHCSEQLRAFFVQEIGPQFHFNGAIRDFIKNGAGKTLQDGIDVWHADRGTTKVETDIAPQLEYNRHMREFFKANPGKTLQDAIAAWKEKKARRKGSRNNNATYR
jgi:hypothetical protein